MKCVGYCRVSTIEQQSEGVSLELQKAKIEAWAIAHDYELIECFSETQSGSRASNRIALQNAIDLACKSKAVLVVYALSRLARSVRDTLEIAERIEKAGASLGSITEKIDTNSAVGRMTFSLISSLSAFERDLLAERTEQAMAHLRRSNRRISPRLPLGYNLSPDGLTLIPNEREQETLAKIINARAAGTPLEKIASQLDQEGVKPKYGTKWHGSSIRSILARQTKLAA